MSVVDTRYDRNGNPVVLGSYGPPVRVINALEAGIVNVTRRVEIYESDGQTLWRPDDMGESRLIDGNVPVDYNSDERRKVDLNLDNTDGLLKPNPNGGFWYDKVIKIYRGVKLIGSAVASPGLIVESANTDKLKSVLSAAGLPNLDINTTVLSSSQVPNYDYYISENQTGSAIQSALLKRLWAMGKNIITIGALNTTADVPLYTATVAGAAVLGVAQPTGDTPTQGAFTTEGAGTAPSANRPTVAAAGVIPLSVWPAVTPNRITAALGFSPTGGAWLDIHLHNLDGAEARKMLKAAILFMESQLADKEWETQIGEFQIDNFKQRNYPNSLSVTGRDYTKRLMQSKLRLNTTFAAGTSLYDFITAVAINGGIPANKMRLSIGLETLPSEMSYDRATDRWSMIKNACTAFHYEIFFDSFGYLIVRPFLDPSTSPVSWAFNTGEQGNLVDFEKSTNDSNVYNHVLVYGDPSDTSIGASYFGEAQIIDPTSPVHRDKIGDRVMPPFVTSFLASDQEAVDLAQSMLRIAALESYNIGFSSVYYPWLEAGEITDIVDPDIEEFEPSRFLLDTINFPLGLGPMTATGKRITFVGSPGSS